MIYHLQTVRQFAIIQQSQQDCDTGIATRSIAMARPAIRSKGSRECQFASQPPFGPATPTQFATPSNLSAASGTQTARFGLSPLSRCVSDPASIAYVAASRASRSRQPSLLMSRSPSAAKPAKAGMGFSQSVDGSQSMPSGSIGLLRSGDLQCVQHIAQSHTKS